MAKRLKPSIEQGKQRAERIRYLRKLLDISREKFATKYGIAYGSLQNWEDVRYGGLTENGACLLVPAFQAEGITSCSIEWLLYGKGEPPARQSFLDQFLAPKIDDDRILAEELQLFAKLHPNSIDAKVVDDGLSPYLVQGDHVAGEKLFAEDIVKAVGKPCIVQTQAGLILIRKLESGGQAGCYDLVCTNSTTTVSPSLEKDVKLFSAAPIIWIRKPRIS